MRYLTEPQLLKVMAAAREKSERNWLIFTLAFNHGLRVSEVLALRPADIRDGFITVKRRKGSNRTTQRLLPDEAEALAKLIPSVKKVAKLFPITQQVAGHHFRRSCADAGISGFSFHSLKHSCAKFMLAHGASLPEVQRRLGHKSLGSTGIYLEANDQDADASFERALCW